MVQHARAHQANGHIRCRVCSLDRIGGAALHWILRACANDDRLAHHSGVAVNLCTELEFDNVTVLERILRCLVTRQRRIVAYHLVDRDSRGEGKSLRHLFVFENGRCALFHCLITDLHQLQHSLALRSSIDDCAHGLGRNFACRLVLG